MQHPQWNGSVPQRFSGGRRHISPQEQLNSLYLSNNLQPSYGIKTYAPKETPQQQFKPVLKVFPESYVPSGKEIDLRGKKPLFLGQQAERNRKQKGHVDGGKQTSKQLELKGIKTYEYANASKQEQYNVEARMQGKIRVLGLEQQRNGLGVTSMGDKSYKYPEYATQFFKDGGLITGSTGFKLRSSENNLPDPQKLKSIFTKPMWSEKVKAQEKQEEMKVLDSVDEWQKTILKQANPLWNDPDTFFERMSKQAGGTNAKDAKKAPKK